MEPNQSPSEVPPLTDVTIEIVHDNGPFDDHLATAWGFAAVVTGPERTILFDTGSHGTLLLDNMAAMGIDPNGIDTVVLSHNHADHTGGLVGFLQTNANVELFLLDSFPARFKQVTRRYGADVIEVNAPREIGPNVWTTGSMGRQIHEQALVIRTEKGLIALTGCAHPGVDKIVEKARSLYEDDLLLVLGGFHLQWATESHIRRIIKTFGRLGVRYVAPTHCTGHKAQELFEKHFRDHCLRVGVGKTIALADLK